MKKFLIFLGILAVIIIAFSLYISTINSEYEVEKSKIIKAPIEVVYNAVNDYNTWVNWGPWRENDDTFTSEFYEKTNGVDAGYAWNSRLESKGSIRTLEVVEDESITQKITTDRRGVSNSFWKFESTDDGTKVIWKRNGELDFNSKLFFQFVGGSDNVFAQIMDTALEKLDSHVLKEMDKHSFTSNGLVEYGGGYYVHLSTECTFDEMGPELDKMLPDVLIYCMKNQYPRAGSLFTLYHKHDEENKIVEFSSCYPVKERVKTDKGFALGFLKRGNYHKTTLQGAYKFSEDAWKKAFEFAKNEGHTVVEDGKPFEVYTKGHTHSANPADWLTEIYLPVE